MAKVRYPSWLLHFRPDDHDKMRAMYRDFLADLPLSQTQLANALGVEQPTVSRWAAGKSTPSVEHMQAVVAVVESRLEEMQERMQMTRLVLDAARDVAAGPRRRSGIGFKKWSAARKRLTKLLDERLRRRRQPRARRSRSPKAGQR